MVVAALPETDGTVDRVLYLAVGRALYIGPSLDLAPHSTSVHCLVLGVDAPFRLRTDDRPEVVARSALIPPRRGHQVVATATTMMFAYLDTTPVRAAAHSRRMLVGHGEFALHHEREEELIELASGRRAHDLSAVLASADTASGPRVDERIRESIDYLSDPLAVTSAAATAAHVAMSPSHFLHTFAAQTGTSFRRYKLWMRMLRVAVAVDAGASFTDAAAIAGFASSSHFSDAFRAMFGLTPTALTETGAAIRMMDDHPR